VVLIVRKETALIAGMTALIAGMIVSGGASGWMTKMK
jgi:hypothetical protein